MFVALDTEGKRVYADTVDKNTECICPVCAEKLKLRKGSKYRPHFSHMQDTDCLYGKDKDYKSPWHIRMQDYFPRENQELRFEDKQTGEVHIADVFLPDSNTVLEFQHSPITEAEFRSRTDYHLKNNRRIVWLFDESAGNRYRMGRFKPEEWMNRNGLAYYKWLGQPRSCLSHIPGPNLKQFWQYFSVCVYTGADGDTFRRIIMAGSHEPYYEYVAFSSTLIPMSENLDPNLFFQYDDYWKREDLRQQMSAQAPLVRVPQIPRVYTTQYANSYRYKRRRF